MKNALLLSGGMDSISIAWWKRPDIAFTVDYGQLAAEAEISASKSVCKHLDISHHVIEVDCSSLGSGDLAGSTSNRFAPATDWWPYRNQMLITLTAMKAISMDVSRLWLGTVSSDESHKDGTLAFITALSNLMSLQEGQLIVEGGCSKFCVSQIAS